MNDFNPYTKKELRLWEQVCAFFEKVNQYLKEHPDVILHRDDDALPGVVFNRYDWTGNGRVIAYENGNCVIGVFSLNEDQMTFTEFKKEFYDEFTFHKKIKVKL